MKFKECPYCGAALDFGERCDCQREEPPKPAVTMKNWEAAESFDRCAKPGDTVEEAIVDEFLNCVPPATYRADLVQCGEPASHREDPRNGKWRPTFATFSKQGKVWHYCGNCFAGDTVEPDKLAS